MSKKELEVKVLSVENKFDGFLKINAYKIEVEKHDGGKQVFERLVMERGHAVSVLGYDPVEDNVVLTNEFRAGRLAAGVYPFETTLPAGMLDKGEDDISAAVREMKEETGLELKEPQILRKGSFVSAGGSSEKLSIVFGLVDSKKAGGVHGEKSEGEDIKTVIFSYEKFIEGIMMGELNDMKTVISAYWLRDHRTAIMKESKAA